MPNTIRSGFKRKWPCVQISKTNTFVYLNTQEFFLSVYRFKLHVIESTLYIDIIIDGFDKICYPSTTVAVLDK